jgi:hypothetical protein
MDCGCLAGAYALSTFQDAYSGTDLGSDHDLRIIGLCCAIRM